MKIPSAVLGILGDSATSFGESSDECFFRRDFLLCNAEWLCLLLGVSGTIFCLEDWVSEMKYRLHKLQTI